MKNEQWLSISAAATACGVSRSTIKRGVEGGTFPNRKRRPPGGDHSPWLIPISDLRSAGFDPTHTPDQPSAKNYPDQVQLAIGDELTEATLAAREASEQSEALRRELAAAMETINALTKTGSGASEPPAPRPAAEPSKARTRAVAVQSTGDRSVAVLDADGVHLSDGTTVPVPPIGHLGDLVKLGHELGLSSSEAGPRGQIWVTAAGMGKFLDLNAELLPVLRQEMAETDRGGQSIPDSAVRALTAGASVVTDALAQGWSLGDKDGQEMRAWTLVWLPGQVRSIWIVLIPAMDNSRPTRASKNVLPVLTDNPTPQTLARRLELFESAVGVPWHINGSATGRGLLLSLKDRDTRDRFYPIPPPSPPQPATRSDVEPILGWSRLLTDDERKHRYVYAWDRSGSHLAGSGSFDFGVGRATHIRDGATFDPKIPGYWRVQVPEQPTSWLFPDALQAAGGRPGSGLWVSTPTLTLAVKQEYDPVISEAYVWKDKARILDTFTKKLGDARMALDVADDPDALLTRELVKQVYTRTFGFMAKGVGSVESVLSDEISSESQDADSTRDRDRIWAPERWHFIVANARNNILRAVSANAAYSGRYPVAAIADTIIYTSDDPDPVSAWPGDPSKKKLGRALGQWHLEGSGLLSDHIGGFTGEPYTVEALAALKASELAS